MKRILIADDDEYIRRLIRIALGREREIEFLEAADGRTALEHARRTRPDLIILDVRMPGPDGIEVCRQLRTEPAFAAVPIVILTASGAAAQQAAGLAAGATAYLTKPFSPRGLGDLVARYLGGLPAETAGDQPGRPPTPDPLAQLFVHAEDLHLSLEDLQHAHRELQRAYLATVDALATALETRDVETAGHCRRVSAVAVELAKAAGIGTPDLATVQYGAALHDVGKIGVPDAILRKTGPLTEDEWTIMRRHPELGERMLAGIDFLRSALPIITYHHERWDGQGYPRGLAGPVIPLGARVFAVADALDAMLSVRPYRPPRTWDEAHDEIIRSSGSYFDPDITAIFRRDAGIIQRMLVEGLPPD